MSKVKIVTDSASDLPVSVLEENGIAMVPLTVHFGDEQYQDVVEMKAEEFYPKLATSPHHPRTSQPSPADFAECYKRTASAGESIVSVHLSSGLSGTYQAAELAKTLVPELEVHVVDSRSGSLGHGLMAIEAARLARTGTPVEEILAAMAKIRQRLFLNFSVDTLEYLHKNGRIGRAQHLLGSLLNMKPILTVADDGYVVPVERVRGKSKVIRRLIELAQEHVSAGATVTCAVMHGNVPDEAEAILEQLKKMYRVEGGMVAPLGAIIGAHVGPGTLGIALFEREGSKR